MSEKESPSERVRASARLIVSATASSVTVNKSACHSAALFLADHLSARPRTRSTIASSWLGANGLHPSTPTPSALSWIFLVDTLNFCFWGPVNLPRWSVTHNGTLYEGYWALCASVNRALQEGIPLTDPSFYATVDRSTLLHIFRSANDVPVPLLDARVQVLNEAGTVLLTSFNASVETLVAAAEGSAQNLVQLLVKYFRSFDDAVPISTLFADQHAQRNQLCFYKRAQILVADVWACFAATDLHSFHDISSLTMFADYRVPQVLAWLRAIEYQPELRATLHSGEELPHADKREIQIRGCAIHAVELIRDEMERLAREKQGKDTPKQSDEPVLINSIVIDFALWDYATEFNEQLTDTPIHRTKSVYY